MNLIKTTLLLMTLTFLFVFVGTTLGGREGAWVALVFAALMNVGAYWFSDKLILMTMGAKEVSRDEAPELYEIIGRLTKGASMPMPKVYIVSQQAPNAFATGRSPSHAAVCVTEGILQILNEEELEAVLGHELSHVRHRDTLISSVAATLAGAILTLARWAQWAAFFSPRDEGGRRRGGGLELLFLAILMPLAATLIQLAISRSREFSADRGGALLSKNPLALASALRKLESSPKGLLAATPQTAHLFIVNPLTGDGLLQLFRTHPLTSERIRRLEEMARSKQS